MSAQQERHMPTVDALCSHGASGLVLEALSLLPCQFVFDVLPRSLSSLYAVRLSVAAANRGLQPWCFLCTRPHASASTPLLRPGLHFDVTLTVFTTGGLMPCLLISWLWLFIRVLSLSIKIEAHSTAFLRLLTTN